VDVVVLVVTTFILALLAPISQLHAFALGPAQSTQVKKANQIEASIDLRTLDFDYPVTLEPEVSSYLNLFSNRRQNLMRGWLARMGLFEDVIYAELKDANCPLDLIAVAMIESGFVPDAYSRAGAVGVWQFMLPTAREMGARVDDWVDERRHIQASTRLAARLLKGHYKRFGNWHLALAAYNAGQGAVSRAIHAAGTNDFWEISRQGLLPKEARNYVPKAIAAMIVIRSPQIVGLETVVKLRPSATNIVSVSPGADLLEIAKGARVNRDELLNLNPHLRRAITPPDGEDFALVVPEASRDLLIAWIAANDRRGGEIFEPITLRFGERLNEVAWRRRVSVRRLRIWNDVADDRSLTPGTTILVPASSKERSLIDRHLVALDNGRFAIADRELFYFPLLYAQSINVIAHWFNLTVNEIRLWNGLSNTDLVPSGLALKLWLDPAKIPNHTLFVSEQNVQLNTSIGLFEARKRRRPTAIRVLKHRIRKGDTLWGISRKYKTPVSVIKNENGVRNRMRLRVGRYIKVPVFETPQPSGAAAKRKAKPTGGGTRYIVRRGDSLWKLSKRFRTNIKRLRRLNNLSRRARLKIGQRLKIPSR
jgi:membrane-bound lytic murein transglycosylase D